MLCFDPSLQWMLLFLLPREHVKAFQSRQYSNALRTWSVVPWGLWYRLSNSFPVCTLHSGGYIREPCIPHPCQCLVLPSYLFTLPAVCGVFLHCGFKCFWCLESQLATHWKHSFCCKLCEQWRRMCSVRPIGHGEENWLLWPGLLPLCLQKDWFLLVSWQPSFKKTCSPHSIVLTSYYLCLWIWDYSQVSVKTNPSWMGKHLLRTVKADFGQWTLSKTKMFPVTRVG